MDKIDRALKRFSSKEIKQIKSILTRLTSKDLAGLNIKKLKNREDIFRLRKGDIRIIYQVREGKIFVLAIERRSEKTYRSY